MVSSGVGTTGHGGTCPLTFINGWTRGVHRWANQKKLTKMYRPSRKSSPQQLIVHVEPKKLRGPPTFEFIPAPLRVIGRVDAPIQFRGYTVECGHDGQCGLGSGCSKHLVSDLDR